MTTNQHSVWTAVIGDTRADLNNRMAELARAKDFFDRAMAQPDNGTGVQRDAIEWLSEAAKNVIDAHFAYLQSGSTKATGA